MLHDPSRHEPLLPLEWNEARARDAIAHIVADSEARFSPETFWPLHPRDAQNGDTAPAYPLYGGACGVIWALTYLEAAGAATLRRTYVPFIKALRDRNSARLVYGDREASYMMGDVGCLLLEDAMRPSEAVRDRLVALIDGNVDHPARELMLGSPGTMLAALFLHERTGDTRWAQLFRTTAQKLRSAGPLRKGSNLCHGTAGNGYAFLKLHARTGDARWLERARAFAMHAITQMQAEERAGGRLRYSLWTGDPGVAVYLMDCIGATPRFPTLDVF